MLPETKLDIMLARHASLEAELSRPLGADTFVKLTRELAEIAPVVEKVKAYRNAVADLADLDAIIADPATELDLRAVAAEEKPVVEVRRVALAHDIRLALIPKDAMDDKNVILEIRAGTGGDEASLFAGDLFRMYERYAAKHGWKAEILSASEGTKGGFKEIVAEITGRGAFTPRPQPLRCCRRSRTSMSESKIRICASRPCGRRVPAASMSTRPNPRY